MFAPIAALQKSFANKIVAVILAEEIVDGTVKTGIGIVGKLNLKEIIP